MDLRQEFVLRAKAPGACVAELCREFGISRKTGYKWLARFEETGVQGLDDMSRRPKRTVHTTGEVVLRVQELRTAHPKWGPKKLRVLLLRALPGEDVPSVKTIARILERLGASRIRRPRRPSANTDRQAPRHVAERPNDLWTVDFKGWWRTRDGNRCEPITVRDACSRFVLCLKAMEQTSTDAVQPVFENLFKRFGMPATIHVDNGAPFGSTRSRAGLSRLSAWWTAVGVKTSFSRPAHPEDNGGHERLHTDVALELEDAASDTVQRQQHAFDAWVEEFNHVRPHEALGMRTPAKVYVRSSRTFRGVRPARYKLDVEVRSVGRHGCIKLDKQMLFVGTAFAGHQVGVERIDSKLVRIQFYEVDLGLFDLNEAPAKSPRAPRRATTATIAKSAPARYSTSNAGGARARRPSPTRDLRGRDGRSRATLVKTRSDYDAKQRTRPEAARTTKRRPIR